MKREDARTRARLAVAALWAGVVLCSAGGALAQHAPGGEDGGLARATLTVSASAEVAAPPDQAVVRLGVVAQADDAAEAQDQVNRIMQDVLEAVSRLAIPERAVRTEQLFVSPVYAHPGPSGAGRPDEPRIAGYRASNVVGIEVDDLTRVGDVIDAGIEAGANELQGVSFRLRREAGARGRALRTAVEDARAQAEVVAGAMGMRISGVRDVTAGGYDVQPPQPFPGMRAAELDAAPVRPGRVEIAANVTATFYIEPAPGGAD